MSHYKMCKFDPRTIPTYSYNSHIGGHVVVCRHCGRHEDHPSHRTDDNPYDPRKDLMQIKDKGARARLLFHIERITEHNMLLCNAIETMQRQAGY